jgi:hypothetical protein
MGELINRNADNWRVLFAIAEMIGADWPERIRDSASTLTPRESESIGPMLLSDMRAIFADKNTDRLASAEICEALAAMEGRPWAEWRVKNASPKPISQNQLARLLKDFHVHPENIYTGGAKRPKGYLLERFAEAFSRFLEPEGVNEPLNRYNADEIRTSSAFRTAQPESGVADQKCEKPASNGRCSGLAVQNGDKGSATSDEAAAAAFPGDGEDRPAGLSWREIDRLAREVEDWAYAHRDKVDISQQSALEAEIRRRLDGVVFPEAVEIELERVTQRLFEPKDARHAS